MSAASSPAPRSARARWPRAAPLALAALLLLVYGRSLASGFVYDDFLHVVDEPVPESLGGLARIFAEPMSPLVPYYRPLARLLTAAQLVLHGPAPLPFHAVNLALAAACAAALYALLRTPALGATRGPAAIAAALFVVHPLASECVYPVASGRETLLPTLLMLLAASAYLRATRAGRAAAVACFALGLFAKEQAMALPAALLAADALRIAPDSPRGARAWLARYAPFALVVAGYALARRAAVPAALSPGIALLEAPAGPLLSLLYHVQTAFAPFAAVIYEPRLDAWWSPPRLALALALAAGLAFAAARRDARRTLWLIAWTLLALAPTANLLAQETRFAERWGFPALAGWAGMLALTIGRVPGLAPALGENPYAPARSRLALRVLLAASAALLVALGAVSFARGAAYRDDGAFLAQWLRTDPTSRQAWISMGELHERRGEPSEAIAAYRRVLSLDPESALAHASLAIVLAGQGRLGQAQGHAERAVALDPNDAESWSNLGGIRSQRGDVAGAIASCERALALRPNLATAHNNLALALRRRGDLLAARSHLEAALAARPQFAEAHANLGDLLAATGDRAGAIRHLERALALDPTLTPARAALTRLQSDAPR